MSETTGEQLAQRFHEAYERLAPSYGYETRTATAVPWDEVPNPNRQLMIAVCAEIGAAHAAEVDALRKELALVEHARDRARGVADERGAELKQLRSENKLLQVHAHTDGEGKLISCEKINQHRDSLARRCAVRFQETEQLRADLAAARAELEEAERQVGEYAAESTRLGEIANDLVQKLDAAKTSRNRIAEVHRKHVDEHGGTWGECAECGHGWPCPTYVWATTDRDPNACWDPADDEPAPAAGDTAGQDGAV